MHAAFIYRSLRYGLVPALVGAALVLLSGPGHAAGAPRAERQAAASLPVGWSAAPSLPTAFTPRWDFAYGYFPPSGQVVVFGGAPAAVGDGWYDDTWLYSAGAWAKGAAAPSGLSPRGGASMAFDPVSGRLVMFGGAGPNQWPPSNQTWLWDGARWTSGPTAPSGLDGRTGAQMAYDEDLHKVVLFGGTGVDAYNDVWFYDGAANSWTKGPATPSSVVPRAFFGMAYDPVLHAVVVTGGDAAADTWFFDGATWTAGPAFTGLNDRRERTQAGYDPQLQATVLFGGLGAGPAVNNVYFLPSSNPSGGWKLLTEDVTQSKFTPPSARLEGAALFVPGQDAMLFFGGVSSTSNGTVAFKDARWFREVAPQTPSVTINALSPKQTESLSIAIAQVTGGYWSTTRTIRWLKNGAVIDGATGTTLARQYLPGDQIQAQVQYVDQLGVAGPWVSSAVATVIQPSITVASAAPGTGASTTGAGFGVSELVDLRLDSPTGTVLKTITATIKGAWGSGQGVPLPSPLVGGTHLVYATGRTTGSTASAAFTVAPGATLTPTKLATGATTTVAGNGFAPNEVVTASFPGGTPSAFQADGNGSFTGTMVSPPEPSPGGNLTLSATSGAATAAYTTTATLKVPGQPAPASIPVALSGFGPSEAVTFTLDGKTQSPSTDPKGSLITTVTIPTTWGTKPLTAAGAKSKLSKSVTVSLKATATVSPSAGPKGTVVTLHSGPGWVPGSTVNMGWAKLPPIQLVASSAGSVDTTYTIPSHPTGTVYFTLSDTVLGVTAKTPFNITAAGSASVSVSDGSPGAAVPTTGAGFSGSEQVDLHLDGPTGAILKTVTAGSSGSWGSAQTMTIPTSTRGGVHTLQAIGRTSGVAAADSFQVVPMGSLQPARVAAGGSTTFAGAGFAPGEAVTLGFPGGTPVTVAADATGSFSAALVSPPEPSPGGMVVASGVSGTVSVPFTVASTFVVNGTAKPGNTALTLTGWGSSETVTLSMGGAQQSVLADAAGSASPVLTLPTTWGSHAVTATGGASGLSMSVTAKMTASVSVSPGSGPKGTVVAVDSGPGWAPGSTVTLTWASRPPVTLTADAAGAVHTTYTIPNHPAGTTYFTLADSVLVQTCKKAFVVQ